MIILPSGSIQVRHGEVVTLTIRSTGAPTNFGVNFELAGAQGVITGPAPTPLTFNWNAATGESDIPDAKTDVLALTFNFTSVGGGQYDYTLAGEGAPPIQRQALQAGKLPTFHSFIFHILHP